MNNYLRGLSLLYTNLDKNIFSNFATFAATDTTN